MSYQIPFSLVNVSEDKRKGEAGGKTSAVGRCGWLNGVSRGHRRQVSGDVSQGSCSVSWNLDEAGQTGHDRALNGSWA